MTDDSPAAVGSVDSDRPDAAGGPANRFPTGHYYSPMYDSGELAAKRDHVWPETARETVGIDWRATEQEELLRIFAQMPKLDFVHDATEDPTAYYTLNDQYPPLDAWVLACMIELSRPARMIEVGSGHSTLVCARANRERLDRAMHLTCIEPHPRDFLTAGVDGVNELRVEQIQDTPLELFAELSAGDVLFIDTSHTVKTGGDVPWIFGEIIPRLTPGVLVHMHDVFIPGDYPEAWVMDGWGWNEIYLIRAFLTWNERFEIVWGCQYMLQNHFDDVVAAFPALRPDQRHGGSSLWMAPRQT
jgi:predicted O-methyltransferase YrrM